VLGVVDDRRRAVVSGETGDRDERSRWVDVDAGAGILRSDEPGGDDEAPVEVDDVDRAVLALGRGDALVGADGERRVVGGRCWDQRASERAVAAERRQQGLAGHRRVVEPAGLDGEQQGEAAVVGERRRRRRRQRPPPRPLRRGPLVDGPVALAHGEQPEYESRDKRHADRRHGDAQPQVGTPLAFELCLLCVALCVA